MTWDDMGAGLRAQRIRALELRHMLPKGVLPPRPRERFNPQMTKKVRANRLRLDTASKGPTDNSTRVEIPPEVAAEHERVLLAPRTLSMDLFGDPLPGRSALDKRRA